MDAIIMGVVRQVADRPVQKCNHTNSFISWQSRYVTVIRTWAAVAPGGWQRGGCWLWQCSVGGRNGKLLVILLRFICFFGDPIMFTLYLNTQMGGKIDHIGVTRLCGGFPIDSLWLVRKGLYILLFVKNHTRDVCFLRCHHIDKINFHVQGVP